MSFEVIQISPDTWRIEDDGVRFSAGRDREGFAD